MAADTVRIKGEVTVRGKPFALIGPRLGIGDQAPDFEVLDNDLQPFRFSSVGRKVAVILSVPSLDTAVCDTETRRFNESAAELGDDVEILVVSMDLPFAQKRWCGAAGVDRVTTLSDHREGSFGAAYGVLIKELRLLARAVFVIDRDRVIRYIELVKELGDEPDYVSAIAAVKEAQNKEEKQ